jgi:hypothetical protein
MKRLVLAVAVTTLALAACGSTGPSGASGSATPAAPSTAASPAASTAAQPSTVAGGGQTDTPWGRIWDTLPNSFPAIPGARPSDEAATGPASATLVIDGDVARLVAAALVTQLAGAGFPTAGLGAPLEDGSYTLDATGSAPGCKVQLTIKPMGGETFVTILYGAACPHE